MDRSLSARRRLANAVSRFDNAPREARPRASTPTAPTQSEPGRLFGVEMELTGPDARTLIDALLEANVPLHRTNVRTRSEIGYQATNGNNVWVLKHDGSVRGYGLELVSPILGGEAGFTQLETVCRVLASVGATVDASAGLHVHIDANGQTVEQIRAQIVAFVNRQTVLVQMVSPSRRNNGYAPLWSTYDLDELSTVTETWQLGHTGPRGAVNLHSYGVHGTIEVRLHGGSTRYDRISAWIRFLLRLFEDALEGATTSTTDMNALLRAMRRGRYTTSTVLSEQDVNCLTRFHRAVAEETS